MRTVVLTGGGSGGHITPILAVATEIKKLDVSVRTVYIGQSGDALADMATNHEAIDEVALIPAGKFRRYHGEGLKQLLDASTVAKNFRDVFKVIKGTSQAFRLLRRLQPVAIYTPGGFVGVPVGFAAARQGIPVLTHDLDALPGLANRLNARWARLHIIALPPEYYHYPPEHTLYAGVPVSSKFRRVTPQLQQQYRTELGLSKKAPVLFVIGGGQGAQRINQAIVRDAPLLMRKWPSLQIIHAAGARNEQAVSEAYDLALSPEARRRVLVKGFINDVYRHSGAADIVVTRAGANNMAEFENQHKTCIVIPSAALSGGHQVKNVQRWVATDSIQLCTEDQLANEGSLAEQVSSLLANPQRASQLASNLGRTAKPHAARTVAQAVLSVAKQNGSK